MSVATGSRLASYTIPASVPVQFQAGASTMPPYQPLLREVKRGPEILVPKTPLQLAVAGVINQEAEDLTEKQYEDIQERTYNASHVTRNIKGRTVGGNFVAARSHKKKGTKKNISLKNLLKIAVKTEMYKAGEMVRVGNVNKKNTKAMWNSLKSHGPGPRQGHVMRNYKHAVNANVRWMKAQMVANAGSNPLALAGMTQAQSDVARGARAIAKATRTRQFKKSRTVGQLELALDPNGGLRRPNNAPPTGINAGLAGGVYPAGGNAGPAPYGNPFRIGI